MRIKKKNSKLKKHLDVSHMSKHSTAYSFLIFWNHVGENNWLDRLNQIRLRYTKIFAKFTSVYIEYQNLFNGLNNGCKVWVWCYKTMWKFIEFLWKFEKYVKNTVTNWLPVFFNFSLISLDQSNCFVRTNCHWFWKKKKMILKLSHAVCDCRLKHGSLGKWKVKHRKTRSTCAVS